MFLREILARSSHCRKLIFRQILRYLVNLATVISKWRGAVVSGVRRMNEVNARRARLVPGWVTVFGRVYHIGM